MWADFLYRLIFCAGAPARNGTPARNVNAQARLPVYSMKRIFVISLFASLVSALSAQFVGDGYYRVHNKKTSRYIYVLDNTGSINVSTASADMGAIELYKDTARLHHDPACIIYAHQVSNGKFDLKAQGTGVHDIIGYYVDVYQKSDGSYQVYAEGKYLDDNETSSRDLGFLGTERTGDYRLWYINKVDNASQYFGVLPTIQLGNKYYKPFYAAFPFSVAGTGMKVYYISQVYRNAAILSELTGTIPASTPVFIECSAPQQWNNKLTIGGTATATAAGNQLRGVYFNNNNRRKSRDARSAYNPVTMRVLTVSPDGQLCFAKSSSLVYLPANESYLNVPSTADDTLRIMTEAEYEVYSKASSITLNQTSLALYPEGTATLTASILPTTVAVSTVSWQSSNPAVATVDAQGNISALSVGTATITASTTDGTNLSAACVVTVNPILATGLSLSKGLFSGIEGDTCHLTATFVPANTTTQSVTWSSSNPAVATVDNGIVTILGVGMATITVSATDGSGVSASCSVVGNPVKVSGMQITAVSDTSLDSLRTMSNFSLSVVVLPDNATSKAVSWSTQNSAIIRIVSRTDSTCTCVALAPGDFVITATAQDGSDVSAQIAGTVQPTKATSLSLTQDSVLISLGDNLQLVYSLLPQETTDKSVRWSSSDTDVLTVNDRGFCQSVGAGTVKVFVSTLDGSGLMDSCVIQVADTVIPPTLARSIVLSRHGANLLLGDSLLLTATVLPLETTDKSFSWISTNPAVLEIDSLGRGQAASVGTTLIIVRTLDGSDLADTCSVTVSPILAESLTLLPQEATLHVDDTLRLSYTLLPLNTTNPAVRWSTSDSTILMVDSTGLVTALALGTAQIRLTTLDGSNLSATCNFAVTPILADSIRISQDSLALTIGDTYSLSAIVFPYNVTNAAVLYGSSAPSVVSVDADGTVHAVGVGAAVITVTTADGSSLTDSCVVTVEPVYVTEIVLGADSLSLYISDGVGESVTLTATVLPEDATFRTVEWSTSDSTIVTVSREGRVVAVSEGSATVFASATDGSEVYASCEVVVKLFTALTEVPSSGSDKCVIYDILGRPVSEITTSGFYIVNGKTQYVLR